VLLWVWLCIPLLPLDNISIKDVPAAMKHCWTRHILYGPCCIKGK
jgi:hypothetical protein